MRYKVGGNIVDDEYNINVNLIIGIFRTACLLSIFYFAGSLKAATIYSSPVSGQVGGAASYATGNYYHQIYQNTGQSYQLDQFALHVYVGGSSSTHNLTGTYGLEVYDYSAGSKGSLLGSFTASTISSQFTNGSSAFRTFTFDLAPGAITIPTQDGIFLLFKTTDSATTYTHASGINASTGWSVGGKFLSSGTFYNVGSTLGTVSVSAVPEPSALSLLAVGLGGLALIRRCRT